MTALRQLARCRIAGESRAAGVPTPLKKLLAGIPHAAAPGGGLFIGERSLEDIKPGKVCLTARLNGRGGRLRAGSDGNYLFAAVEGYPAPLELQGRTFGVYASGSGRKLAELAVDEVVLKKSGANIYFFPAPARFKRLASAGELFVTHPAEPAVLQGAVRCWDLSLVNAAVALELARRGLCYAWLPMRGIPAPRELKLVRLQSFDSARSRLQFGLSMEGAADISSSLRGLSGRRPEEPVLAWLGLSCFANANARCRFDPESIPAGTIAAYAELLTGLVKELEAEPRASASGAAELWGDETGAIAALVGEADDFGSFLSSSGAALAAAYKRHGLRYSSIRADDFIRLKRSLPALRRRITAAEAGTLSEKAAEMVRGCFPPSRVFYVSRAKVVSLLFGNSAVFRAGNGTVFVSPEKADGSFRKRLLSELLLVTAERAFKDLGLAPGRAEYLAGGLRTWLLAGRDKRKLAGALGLPAARYSALRRALPAIRRKASLALSGDICRLHEGRFHRYMKLRPEGSFPAPEEACALAALEIAEAAARGGIYEEILS